ncbi:MAG: hypothetical protein AAGE52_11420 [Myxococcota bacterium]
MKSIAPLTLLALAPLLLAADCNDTPQACQVGDGPIECEGEQLPSCINYCFPTVSAEEADGAVCVVDPCDEEVALGSDAILCPNDFACVPDSPSSRTGRCIQRTALSGCEADGSPPCPTGTFCRLFSPVFKRPHWIDPASEGMCMPWIGEGSPCLEAGNPANLQCEPGTYCRPMDPEGSADWRCVRACENDDDCPCPNDEFESECTNEGSSAPTCTTCFRVGNACDLGELAPECCGDAICDDFADGVSDGSGICCRQESGACETDADCCGANLCFEGECAECGSVGEPPPDAGCCRGLTERNDVCSAPCRWQGETVFGGEDCTPTGAHETCFGRIVCTPAGAECRPRNAGPDLTCNGIDEDCDGVVDDDYVEGSCTDTPAECQSGFRPSTPGRKTCDYPDEPCSYRVGLRNSYCRLTSATSYDGPGDCLVGPAGINCTSNSQCSEVELCGPAPDTDCSGSGGGPGCCPVGPGGTMFAPCCRIDPDKVGTCWNPR